MNAIILYGGRYGASQTYAQALEARTGIPAVAYQEIQDFGPFDTIVYIGGLYAGKTTGLAKTVRHFPTDHPFRLLVATVGLSDPAVEDNLLRIRGVPGPGTLPRHLRAHHPCPPPRGHRLQRSHHPPPADDEGLCTLPAPPAGGGPVPQTPRPCWTATAKRWISSTWTPWPPSKPGWKRAENPVYYSTKPDRLTTLLPAGPSCFPQFLGDFPTSAPLLSQNPASAPCHLPGG